MTASQKVLFIDAPQGYYKIRRYPVGDYFGPVDLGLHLSDNYHSLNIGTGLLAGSIFPGSNRLVFTGFSPCWRGFYISSMGGAGLVFSNLGINLLSTYYDPGHFRDDMFYVRPERALEQAHAITRWVSLRHDYMPHDFTLYLYRKG